MEEVKVVWHTPLRCFLGFHRWPKWSDLGTGKFRNKVTNQEVEMLYQSRICPDCHKYDWRIP